MSVDGVGRREVLQFTIGAAAALALAACTSGSTGSASATSAAGSTSTTDSSHLATFDDFISGTWSGWVTRRKIPLTILVTKDTWTSTAGPDAKTEGEYWALPNHTVRGTWERSGQTVNVSTSDPNLDQIQGPVGLSVIPDDVSTPELTTISTLVSWDSSYDDRYKISWDGTTLSATDSSEMPCLQLRKR